MGHCCGMVPVRCLVISLLKLQALLFAQFHSCCEVLFMQRPTLSYYVRCLAGLQLVVSSHGSALHFLSTRGVCAMQQPAEASPQLLSLTQLPMRCVSFLSEAQVVAGGFDGTVCVSCLSPEESLQGTLDSAPSICVDVESSHDSSSIARGT